MAIYLFKKQHLSDSRSRNTKFCSHNIRLLQYSACCFDMQLGQLHAIAMVTVMMVVYLFVVVVLFFDGDQPDRRSIVSGNESLVNAEKPLLRWKRSFLLADTGKAEETGYYSFANKNNSFIGLMFGRLLFKATGRIIHECEGVLIGPKHVLSLYPE